MHRSTTSADAFLASLPDGIRDDLVALDAELARVFAGHERVLWEGPMWGGTHQRIIGYGALRQPRPSGEEVDWFVVGLAAQKAHLSLYVGQGRQRPRHLPAPRRGRPADPGRDGHSRPGAGARLGRDLP